MPLNANEEALLGQPSAAGLEPDHQRLVRNPEEKNKIGKWSITALILNRAIGSGIFLTPHRILQGTGCVAGALFVWTLACLLSLCGLYVWLECGLSMPQRRVRGETEPRGVPRSGGEKNYLEFMFPNVSLRLPHIRTTCSFAIMYILIYNLAGNAIAFALQALAASGHYGVGETPGRGPVLGIAVGVLTLNVLLHTFSRSGGILINNAFAIIKVALLLTIFLLGVAKAAGAFGGSGQVIENNFVKDVWTTQRTDIASWSNSLLLCTFAMSGWKQPFYVLAEAKSPRKHFTKFTVLGWAIVAVLYLLVNISYLLVVDKSQVLAQDYRHGPDMATLFIDRLFGDNHVQAARAMSAIIAFSIFGNLWITTFTAARLKQEIAKEGILPWSLYIAASYRTPYGLCKKWLSKRPVPDSEVERAPTLAYALHWFSSVLLIIVVAPIADPRKSYFVLTNLYAYGINTLVGFAVSAGLLLVKLRKSTRHWQARRRYRPWMSPAHVVTYAAAMLFLLVTAFVPPAQGSPFRESVTGLPWYVVPAIALSAPFWGVLWYWGLQVHEWRIGRRLLVSREAYWMPDPKCRDEYIQVAEIVDLTWQITPRHGMSEDFTSVRMADLKSSALERGREAADSDDESFERGRTQGVPSASHQRVPLGGSRRLSDSFDH